MNIRRVAGLVALVAAASTALITPTVGAQTVSYSAESAGSALDLQLAGNGLTVGGAASAITDAPAASASGRGLASVLADAGATEAAVEGDGTDGSPDETCESDAIPDLPGLDIGLACSASVATVADGNPASGATARVGLVELDPVSGLLIDELGLQDVIDQVVAGAEGILGPLGEGLGVAPPPLDAVDDLLNDVVEALDVAPLATVDIAPTAVETFRTADATTATCAAQGATIDVLDLPPVAGGIDAPPVISVIVGDASTSVSTANDGTDTSSASPALVRVVVPALAVDLPVEVGETVEIPLPDPLGTSTISVADGTTGTDDDGRPFAQASAVSIDLLPGLEGGVSLDLADCYSVAGAAISAPPTTEAPTTTAPSLPRTGGTGANGWAMAATVALALGGLALLRSGRTA